jgi:hypothetical protein
MLEIVQIGRNKKLALSLKWDQDRLKGSLKLWFLNVAACT